MQFHHCCDQIFFVLICSIINQKVFWYIISLTMILYAQNLKKLFTRISSTHFHNTRAAAAGKFHVIHSRTKQQEQSLSRLGARIWNKIPELLKSKPKQSFKRHPQTKLLQFLVHEGVYVDVYNLADKLFLHKNLNIYIYFFFHDKFHLFVFFSMYWSYLITFFCM